MARLFFLSFFQNTEIQRISSEISLHWPWVMAACMEAPKCLIRLRTINDGGNTHHIVTYIGEKKASCQLRSVLGVIVFFFGLFIMDGSGRKSPLGAMFISLCLYGSLFSFDRPGDSHSPSMKELIYSDPQASLHVSAKLLRAPLTPNFAQNTKTRSGSGP